MRIIVCAKHVVDSTEIRWDDERGEVILRNLPTKISDYDRNALEAAVVLKETGEFVDLDVLMVGGEAAVKSLKEAVAMGADKGYLIEDGWLDAFDPLLTARVLAKAVEKLGDADVVMCGLVSEDGYNGLTPAALAELLQVPYVAPVVGIKIDDDGVEAVLDQGDTLTTVRAPLPCVIGVDSSMNVPRLPTVLQTMKVKSDRIGRLSLGDLDLSAESLGEIASGVELRACTSSVVERQGVVLDGSPEEAAAALVAKLREAAVL